MAKSGVVYVARKTKESRIKAEKARLKTLYNDLPESRHKLAEGLIERAAFMRVELEELEEDLKEHGWAEMFSQGNQEPYPRARPQGQSYNTMNANYLKVIQKLDTMLPKEQDGGEESDGFDAFVNGRDADFSNGVFNGWNTASNIYANSVVAKSSLYIPYGGGTRKVSVDTVTISGHVYNVLTI